MSALTRTAPGARSSARPPADTRRTARALAASLLPIGPALIAVLRFVMPYDTTDSATTIAHKIAAHRGAENAVVWLGFGASLIMVPTVLWVGRYVGRSAPRLTTVALLLLVPGYSVLGLMIAGDAAALYGVKHGMSAHTVGQIYESVHPIAIIGGVIFVIGHVLGTVLLAIAMIRGRSVPLWAGIITLVAQPLHFIAAVIVTSHPLDLVAWGLNAVGFAVVSAALLRMDDDAWAPAPEGSTR